MLGGSVGYSRKRFGPTRHPQRSHVSLRKDQAFVRWCPLVKSWMFTSGETIMESSRLTRGS